VTPSSLAFNRVVISVTLATDDGCTAPTAGAALPALDELDEKRREVSGNHPSVAGTPHSAVSSHAGSTLPRARSGGRSPRDDSPARRKACPSARPMRPYPVCPRPRTIAVWITATA
jgi:hypothetical protein